MIPPTKLGWMAGVIDLKGRVVKKENKMRKSGPQVTLIVETRTIPIVKELGFLTGTMPETRQRQPLKEWMRRGCSEHCPDKHIHVEDEREMPTMGRWTISGAGLAVVLFNLMPFLLQDYKTIYDEVIVNSPLKGQGSGAVVATIRRLALLGWDLPEQFLEVEI